MASEQPQLLLSMNDFANYQVIGRGRDCTIFAATTDKLPAGPDGAPAAVVLKVYEKAKISAIKHRSVRREARIMRYLTDKRIPHTTAYTGAFQDSKQIYIVMEHCKGGDLLEQLLREGRAMPERRVVREVVLPTLTALAHLHAAGIIHRDIKLENLFISSNGHLQLGDFGLAISVLEERAISPVGTLEYMAPEILRLPSTDSVMKGVVRVEDVTPIDEKVDVWSFGVTVYELVTGRSPFEGSGKEEIKAAILAHRMRPLPAFLSAGCQDFILKALATKAGDRPGALTLLSHPWVQMHCSPQDLVTITRLPLQLPKVPMGYKHQQQQQAAAPAGGKAAGAAAVTLTASATAAGPAAPPAPAHHQQQQQQAAAASPAAVAAAAAADAAAAASPNISPSSTVSSPVADAAASIVIGGDHKHEGSMQQHAAGGGGKQQQPLRVATSTFTAGAPGETSSGSMRSSNGAFATADSAASLCAPGAGLAAGGGSSSKGWASAGAGSAALWTVHAPIQELPADDAAQRHDALQPMQPLQQQLRGLSVQQQELAAAKCGAATAAGTTADGHASHNNNSSGSGGGKAKKPGSSAGSSNNKLFRWICSAGGTQSPTDSLC